MIVSWSILPTSHLLLANYQIHGLPNSSETSFANSPAIDHEAESLVVYYFNHPVPRVHKPTSDTTS
jgi:hypothetical protein